MPKKYWTLIEAQKILDARKQGILCKTLGLLYGVSQNAIRKVIQRYDVNYMKPYFDDYSKYPARVFSQTDSFDVKRLIKHNRQLKKNGWPIARPSNL